MFFKRLFFENVNISTNNIISVDRAAKALQYSCELNFAMLLKEKLAVSASHRVLFELCCLVANYVALESIGIPRGKNCSAMKLEQMLSRYTFMTEASIVVLNWSLW